jgi:ATP-dependent Clp endopeptidase proteolytic subunit ClpP
MQNRISCVPQNTQDSYTGRAGPQLSEKGNTYMIFHHIDPKIKSKKIEDLVDLPHTILVNKFDEESAKSFRDHFNKALNTGQKVIPIIIDSYGGQVYSLMSMIETIRSANDVKVATIATGKAMSCGAVLFTCGHEELRFMAPFATLMIHDVSSGAFGKVEEIKADAKEVERLNQFVYRLMAKNVGKEEEYFLKLVQEKGHADWYIDADEARKHNLCNHIRIPSFKVKISSDITFG